MAAARVARDLAATMSGGDFVGCRILSACAGDAHLIAGQISPAVIGIVRIRQIRATPPLPTIARRIEHAEWTRAFWQTPYRLKVIPAGAEMRATRIRRIIAPRILSTISAARGFFPLGFGR